jgi:hypothetical protein
MKNIVYVLFKYYNDGKQTKDIAYEQALISLTLVVLFNIITIFNVLNIETPFESMFDQLGKVGQYAAILLCYFLPAFFILRLIYTKRGISDMTYDDVLLKRHGYYVFLYFLMSFILLIITTKTGPK